MKPIRRTVRISASIMSGARLQINAQHEDAVRMHHPLTRTSLTMQRAREVLANSPPGKYAVGEFMVEKKRNGSIVRVGN